MLEIWAIVFVIVWIASVRDKTETHTNVYTAALFLVCAGIFYTAWEILDKGYTEINTLEHTKTISVVVDNIPGVDPVVAQPSDFSIALIGIFSVFAILGIMYLGFVGYKHYQNRNLV